MPIRAAHRQLKKGLGHPNRWVAAATWLLLLALLAVLARMILILIDDFWVILIAWMQS